MFVDEDVKELIGGLADEMRRGFAKLDAKVDEKFEESKRYFGVPAEDLFAQMKAAAESAAAARRENATRYERLSTDLAEIKSMIPIFFKQLHARIRSLETDNADLQSRLERLQSAH